MENQTCNSENVEQNVTSNDQRSSATIPGRDNDRKLFVGGLTRETTEKDLQDYFVKFGAIDSVNIKIDQNTGNSKGFGFIVFNTVESIAKVTAAGDHVLNNKKIDAQMAKVRNSKIFVGGITNEMTDEDLKTHFGQFGKIVGIEVPFDKTKNQRKNFCFVIFESEEMAKQVLQNSKQIIKNKQVDVKRAAVKSNQAAGQGVSFQQNFDGFGENWNGPYYGNQAFGGYEFNQQEYAGTYGGYDAGTGYESYATLGYQNYGHLDQTINNGGNRRGFRGGSRGTNRGASRGRGGGRFQPY